MYIVNLLHSPILQLETRSVSDVLNYSSMYVIFVTLYVIIDLTIKHSATHV